MDVDFLCQNLCIPSWPSVFLFGSFLSVALTGSRCTSSTVPRLSISNYFSMLFIHSGFCYLYSVPIFYSKIVLLCLHPVVVLSSWILHQIVGCPIGGGGRINQLQLCRGVIPTKDCPGYDTKQSDGEVSVMLGLWEMQSTPSLTLLPCPLWLGVVATDRALSMG